MSVISKNLSGEFHSVDDVISGLDWFEKQCLDSGDLRGVFATAYLHITRSMNKQLRENQFRNNQWTEKYLVRFGNLYRIALIDFELSNLSHVPKSWQISFETAARKEGFIIQHLLMGVNAHINHDLAIALFEVDISSERADKYADHNLVNKILEDSTEGLKSEVSTKYAPILRRLDRAAGTMDDRLIQFSIPKAREHAWAFAVALTNAPDDQNRKLIRRSIDEQAAVLARLIMSSPINHPKVTRTVKAAKWLDRAFNRFRDLFR